MKAEPDIAPQPAEGCGRAYGPAFFLCMSAHV